MSAIEAVLRWYLASTAITMCFLPLTLWLGRRLRPAQYALVRPLGLIVAAWLVWWPALVVDFPFTRANVIVVVALAGVAQWVLWWRRGRVSLDLPALLAFEAVWLALFSGYLLFRSYNPDIANTEKPMEIALFSSIVRSSAVPAPDPWLAGAAINYYYFGYQTFATLAKATGTAPSVAFNLALGTIFASCGTIAAGIGWYLARLAATRRAVRVMAAAIAPALLLLGANLETSRRLLQDFWGTVRAGWWDGVGWQASRIIYDSGVHGNPNPKQTINEFPAFSFVLADLHPHVLTYPLLALVLALAIGIAMSSDARSYPRLAVTGGLIGMLYASNSWDAPAGLLFVGGALLLVYRSDLRRGLLSVGVVLSGALLAVIPFVLTFHAPVGVSNPDVPQWIANLPIVGTVVNTVAIVNWRPSSPRELLIVHGVWIAAFVGWFAAVIARGARTRSAVSAHRDGLLIAASLTLGLAIIWMPALVLLGWPVALSLWVALTREERFERLTGGLFALGFLLVLLPEVFYIQDVFSDRMNTVFKLYFQGWLVLSVATVAGLLGATARASRRGQIAVWGTTAALLVLSLTYTPLSAWDWTAGFAQRKGLDGAAYIALSNPADQAAIAWINDHAVPGDTLVEAPGCAYQVYAGAPYNRMSAFTGVPALVGWENHENQWRRGDSAWFPVIAKRVEDANAILSGLYTRTSDGIEPRFLVLGRQETDENPNCSLSVARDTAVLDALGNAGWVVAFEYGETRVFVRSDDPLAHGVRIDHQTGRRGVDPGSTPLLSLTMRLSTAASV
ncbi:MAG: hypothetical protein DCC58_11500 [Chloroflexi bacterium]|nr:MAG: hypothetical protein DCC58_11500 [Chloroflexota bacterium]